MPHLFKLLYQVTILLSFLFTTGIVRGQDGELKKEDLQKNLDGSQDTTKDSGKNGSGKSGTSDNRHVPGSFFIHTDQDYFFLFPASLNEDRNYTQGTCFTYSHEDLNESFFFWPVKKLGELNKGKELYSSSFSLGGTAFTPLCLDSIDPIVGDRPFSFLLYVSTSSTYSKQKSVTKRCTNQDKTNKVIETYHTFNINYGLFGTKLGYEFQSFAHKYLVRGRPEDPKGWNNRISKGGAPTILIEYNRFRPLFGIDVFKKKNLEDRSLFDVGWNFGGSVGYYDRINTGLYARLGYLKKSNQAKWNGMWSALSSASYQTLLKNKNMTDSTSTTNSKTDTIDNDSIANKNTEPEVKDSSHTVEQEKPKCPKFKNFIANVPEIFLFGRAGTTLMLRNSMLVGQRFFGNNEYVLDSTWPNTFLLEFEWGAAFNFECKRKGDTGISSWAIVLRTMYRSPEFDSRIFPTRWHYFGSAGICIAVR